MYSSHEKGDGYMLSLNSFGYLTRPQGYDRREIDKLLVRYQLFCLDIGS
jgi:hypothetical protein